MATPVVLAGTAGTAGYTDATGTSAKFDDPVSITGDDNDTLYVADFNNQAIRKVVISTGVVTTLLDLSSAVNALASPISVHMPPGSNNLYIAYVNEGGSYLGGIGYIDVTSPSWTLLGTMAVPLDIWVNDAETKLYFINSGGNYFGERWRTNFGRYTISGWSLDWTQNSNLFVNRYLGFFNAGDGDTSSDTAWFALTQGYSSTNQGLYPTPPDAFTSNPRDATLQYPRASWAVVGGEDRLYTQRVREAVGPPVDTLRCDVGYFPVTAHALGTWTTAVSVGDANMSIRGYYVKSDGTIYWGGSALRRVYNLTGSSGTWFDTKSYVGNSREQAIWYFGAGTPPSVEGGTIPRLHIPYPLGPFYDDNGQPTRETIENFRAIERWGVRASRGLCSGTLTNEGFFRLPYRVPANAGQVGYNFLYVARWSDGIASGKWCPCVVASRKNDCVYRVPYVQSPNARELVDNFSTIERWSDRFNDRGCGQC